MTLESRGHQKTQTEIRRDSIRDLPLIPVSIGIFSLVVFGVLVMAMWNFTLDDSFISYRYARNLAGGYGPTYNPGAAPIEGYTSFLWVLILALPHWLHLNAVTFSKLTGISCVLACMAICCRWVWRLTDFVARTERYLCTVSVVAFLASFAPAAVHAISGMETAMFSLWLSLFLYLCFAQLDSPSTGLEVSLALAALLLGLTRPEGNLVAAVGILMTLVFVAAQYRQSLLKAAAFLYVLPGILYFLWRSAYYKSLLPLPFYVKVASQSHLAGLPDVAAYAWYITLHVGPLVLIGLFRTDVRLAPAYAAVLSLLLFFIVPAHIMGFNWRFLYPVTPIIFVFASLGFGELMNWFSSRYESSTASA